MTFMQSLNAFADRVLETTLGTVEAGACVPSHGQECLCEPVTGNYCYNQHRWTQYQYSCLGGCLYASHACC